MRGRPKRKAGAFVLIFGIEENLDFVVRSALGEVAFLFLERLRGWGVVCIGAKAREKGQVLEKSDSI